MIYIYSVIFALICLWLFGPVGFFLAPIILYLIVTLNLSSIFVYILLGFLFFIMQIYKDRFDELFYKIIKTFSVIISYLGVYLGILCTLTYANSHWWMLFTYLLFMASQLFLTFTSSQSIGESTNAFKKGIATINVFICTLISLFPFCLRFRGLYINSPKLGAICYLQYEGGIIVYLLTVITFFVLLLCLLSIIISDSHFINRNFRRSFILATIISSISHISIIYLLLHDAYISIPLPFIDLN